MARIYINYKVPDSAPPIVGAMVNEDFAAGGIAAMLLFKNMLDTVFEHGTTPLSEEKMREVVSEFVALLKEIENYYRASESIKQRHHEEMSGNIKDLLKEFNIITGRDKDD